jgi:DNA-binding transcriptional LysR family regulator
MIVSPNDLIFLLELTRSKSISSAAKKMGLDQSTLSRQLASLEEKVGQSLFSRHRSGLEPSSYVKSLMDTAEKVELLVLGLRGFKLDQGMSPKGEVHISCPSSIADRMLAYHLSRFLKRYPGIKIRLSTSSHNFDLNKLECDLAIRIGKPTRGDTVNLKIVSSPLKFFGARGLVSNLSKVSIEKLPLILLKNEVKLLKDTFNQFDEGQVRVVSNSLATNLVAAERGAGALLIPEVFGFYLKSLDLIEVEGWSNPPVTIFMSSPKVVRRLPHVEAAWNWVKELFSSGPLPMKIVPALRSE